MYLGSHAVNWQGVSSRDSSILEEIIMRTISIYNNSFISLISSCTFAYCTDLTSINLPNVVELGSSAFTYCSNLTSINLPQVVSMGWYAFSRCTNLSEIKLPNINLIGNSAFCSCYNLLTVDLRRVKSVPTLGYAAFSSTPISNYTTSTGGVYGSIYVPASLYSSFVEATYWSEYSSHIISI